MRFWLCNLLKRLEGSQSERKRVVESSRSLVADKGKNSSSPKANLDKRDSQPSLRDSI